MRIRFAAIAVFVLVLAGCTLPSPSTVSTTTSTASTPTPTASAPIPSAPATSGPVSPTIGSFWADNSLTSMTVKKRVDLLALAKDCVGLQYEFDIADAHSAATRSRTGHGNGALMGYIDDAMRTAGCYG